MQRLLIIGGAGYVGSIVRPALEERYECTHLDRRDIPGARGRVLVGDLDDDVLLEEALAGQDAVLYLAMGTINNDSTTCGEVSVAFDVNVRGIYRVLLLGLRKQIRRFVYASSLSVYSGPQARERLDESMKPNCWQPYGLSKRTGEFICQAAADSHPDATVLALRLFRPQNEADWAAYSASLTEGQHAERTAPNDMRRLMVAAVEFGQPGFHAVQASGDREGVRLPNDRAASLLGWQPQGE